jgi:hypothetical protein
VVCQELDLTRLQVEVGERQVGLAKRRPGRPQGRRSGRTCRTPAASAERPPSASAAPGSPARRGRSARARGDRRRGDNPRAQTAARSRGRGPIRADARALPVACDRQLVAKLAGVELTAAAVWLCLWGSIPIVITAGAPPMLGVSRTDLRRTRLTGARARFYQVTPAIRPSPGHRQRCITASGGDAGTCAHHRATPACFIACRRGADEDPGG